MRDAFAVAAGQGAIRPIRIETYLHFLYIGSAAATAWTDYDVPQTETDGGADTRPVRFSKKSAAKIERVKDEAEDLVVRLLSPSPAEAGG